MFCERSSFTIISQTVANEDSAAATTRVASGLIVQAEISSSVLTRKSARMRGDGRSVRRLALSLQGRRNFGGVVEAEKRPCV